MKIDTLRVSDEVRDALAQGKPVVALESTIFTHGLPRPRNVEVAMRGEEIVREGGGVPATIGVVHGQSVVGLSPEEINELAYDDDVTKASVRDLAYTAVSKKNAGTTIASTSHRRAPRASTCSRLAAWVVSTTVRRRRLTSPRTSIRWRARPSSW